jgi:hypothetical protein
MTNRPCQALNQTLPPKPNQRNRPCTPPIYALPPLGVRQSKQLKRRLNIITPYNSRSRTGRWRLRLEGSSSSACQPGSYEGNIGGPEGQDRECARRTPRTVVPMAAHQLYRVNSNDAPKGDLQISKHDACRAGGKAFCRTRTRDLAPTYRGR